MPGHAPLLVDPVLVEQDALWWGSSAPVSVVPQQAQDLLGTFQEESELLALDLLNSSAQDSVGLKKVAEGSNRFKHVQLPPGPSVVTQSSRQITHPYSLI